ncbi:MAG: DUF3996 domain-containing protein [Proteobacteria bacterium]|nr:MAG: DUF3996 domain-containing protein [Pseudomonadota bacterium]
MLKLARFFGFVVFFLLLIITHSNPARARPSERNRNLGLGVVLGDPSGITAKLWTDQIHAIDAGLAFSLDDYFLVYSDYLWHFPNAIKSSEHFLNQLNPYIGVGGTLSFGHENHSGKNHGNSDFRDHSAYLGVRIPLGIEWTPDGPPLGIFLEIVPQVTIIPGTHSSVGAGIGIRYFF